MIYFTTQEKSGERITYAHEVDSTGCPYTRVVSREQIPVNKAVVWGPVAGFVGNAWFYLLIISIFGLVLIEVLGPIFYVALGAGLILGVWRLAVSPRTLRARRMFLRHATVAVGGFFLAMVEEVRDRVTSIF